MQQAAIRCHHAGGFTAGMHELAEALIETGGLQGHLAVALVDIEHASLGADVRRRVGFVDH
jgi:hypothetical protein